MRTYIHIPCDLDFGVFNLLRAQYVEDVPK